MSERIRSFDWSTTPLGALDTWPATLKAFVSLMLATRQPASIGWGPKLTFLHNDALIPILGVKYPAALGAPYENVWAEVWEDYRPLVEATLAGKPQYFVDEPIALAGRPGVPMSWFTFSWTPLGDDDGKVQGLYATVVEMTEKVRSVDKLRRAKQAALRRTERRYRALFNSIDEGFCIIEVMFDDANRPVDYRYLETNPMFEKAAGMRDAVGRTARELVPQIERSWVERYGGVARTGDSIRFTDYSEPLHRWFEVFAFRVDEPSERHVAILFRDVTREHQAEVRLKSALQIKTVGVVFWNEHFQLDDMNDAFLEMSGLTREEAIGKSWQDFTPPEFYESSRQAVREVRTRGESTPYEKQYYRKDGSRWWGLFAARRIGREVVEFVLDVSERRQAEEALRAADKRKDEFLATLAHELRNPLAALGAAATLLNRQSQKPAVIALAREALDRQVTHMARLLDDLLDLARITHGVVQLRLECVDIVESIRSAAQTVCPQIEAKHHELKLSLPKRPVYVRADPVRLTQIFGNLLNNAAKYTHERGNIEVHLVTDDDRATVTVKDDGIGIDEELLNRVFEMFAQGKQLPQSGDPGLGIGLSLVKGLLTMHKGTIRAHSAGHGQGSEFIVCLPLDHSKPSTTGKAAAATDASDVAPLRILVADDNLDSATGWAMLLEQDGHEVRTAYDGQTALEEAERFKPEVALLDIGLPLLDGYQLARRIRALPWGSETTLAAITGWGQASDRERAQQAGFDHHFTKPASFDDVKSVLREAHKRVH